jgi:hypothetical protein
MDLITVSAYDLAAADFARDWHSQPPPDDMYAAIKRFFASGGRTAASRRRSGGSRQSCGLGAACI